MSARPFRALLWKESREVLPHAGAIAAVVALIFYWSVGSPPSTDGDSDPGRHFLWLVTLGSLAAVSIGYWQTARERETDMWGFALHRPASATQIFGAKLLVGVGALVGMMFVPFAAAMCWVSMPGVRSVPVDRAYWLPGIADLFVAIMCYTGGLYLGTRRTKRFPGVISLVVLLGAYLAVVVVTNFAGAIAICIAISAVMIGATWSDFMTGSDFDAKPWWGRAASVAAGIPAVAVVLSIALGTSDWIGPDLSPKPWPAPSQPQMYVNGQGKIDTVRNNGGKFTTGVLSTGAMPTVERETESTNNYGYRDARRWVTRLYASNAGSAWYYERREGLISTYDAKSRLLTGYLGPDGFTAGPVRPTTRFKGYLQVVGPRYLPSPRILALSDGMYALEELASAKPIMTAAAGETILGEDVGASRGLTPETNSPWSWYRAIVTTKGIHILDQSGGEQIAFEHPAEDRGKNVMVYRAPTAVGAPTYIWYRPRRILPGDTLNHVFEFRMGSAKPVAEYRLRGSVFVDGGYFDERAKVQAIVIPLTAIPGVALAMRRHAETSGLLLPDRATTNRALMWSVVICLVTGLAAFGLCRRYAFSRRRTVTWAVLAAVIGPVVLVVMWMLLDWPRRKVGAAIPALAG